MVIDRSPPVRIIGGDFTLYGEVDAYSSLTITEGYSAPGSFSCEMASDGSEPEIIRPGRFIICDGFYGIIERVVYRSGDDGDTVTFAGSEAGGMLANRICIPPSGQAYDTVSGAPGECMAELVAHQAIEPADAGRALPIYEGEIEPGSGEIEIKARYETLSEIIAEAAQGAGLGWRIYADLENRQWVFTVYAGRDMSAGGASGAAVIFSPQYENVSGQQYEWSTAETCNKVVAAGQGEGTARMIAIAYEGGTPQTGLALREKFVDARDLTTMAGLQNRAQQRLAQNAETRSFEGSIALSAARDYGDAWRLGDIVTVRHDGWGAQIDARITEVTRAYQQSEVKIDAVFGDAPITLSGKLKRLDSEFRSGQP